MNVPPGIYNEWKGQRVNQKGRPRKVGTVTDDPVAFTYYAGRWSVVVTWEDGSTSKVNLASLKLVGQA